MVCHSEDNARSPIIGTLNESPLHAGLKSLVAEPGDEFEQHLGNYVVDIKRGNTVIEIQTSNFAALRRKLEYLLDDHTVRVIHPIAHQKWIVNEINPAQPKRRRSPKTQGLEVIWGELVSIPTLLSHPRLSLEFVLTHQEEVRVNDPGTRKKWRVQERRLLEVLDRVVIQEPSDLLHFLPADLPAPFTTRDIGDLTGWGEDIGRQVAYCLRESGATKTISKQGNRLVYSVTENNSE